MKNITNAPKSTLLGVLLILLISTGVYTGHVDKEALLALIPAITLIITNIFKEGKTEDSSEG